VLRAIVPRGGGVDDQTRRDSSRTFGQREATQRRGTCNGRAEAVQLSEDESAAESATQLPRLQATQPIIS
jgi:hypothetical protein